ncbi:unnamed protein product [Meloidogyne enterolobii]|uniref:Uncharacterized protein n=1 Tax=Meloidogyne enterolobii TaxID=390850 RepID=A0ACB1AQV9_MELEN
MEKIISCPTLSPNNSATKINPPQLVIVDQDYLDQLSDQLKLLKIDDFTINKILKKFKPIKKEVKFEPQECHQVFDPQQQQKQQPFVGYDGLLEFAISQVKNCGYGHVLPPLALLGNKKLEN